ncbi:MAG: hypothetical protein P0Y53_25280 [Candidatus Pseudobacter hemicellulosilyticus]|uniref:Uncharacterized protein n=1 Tax=Candidatus Pseudobacter hemicellulosilyticus TaxID=3121375 RepID=A0AAJ5WSL1_9BACT|nr:MAG: hypothetical protein P0Y53_25280 [Pseudobacter sp.]
MLKTTGLLLALAGSQLLYGQWPEPPTLDQYSPQLTDMAALRNNTGALAGVTQWQAGLQARQLYGLPELQQYALVAAGPVATGKMGITVTAAGPAEARHTGIGLGLARLLGRVGLGIQFRYQEWRVAGYGTNRAAGMDLGAVCQLTDRLQAGWQWRDPLPLRWWKGEGEQLATRFTAGLGYTFSPAFLLAAEMIREAGRPTQVHAGFRYLLAGSLLATMGLYTGSGGIYGSLGWQWAGICVTAGGQYHIPLGLSPWLGLHWQPQKKQL